MFKKRDRFSSVWRYYWLLKLRHESWRLLQTICIQFNRFVVRLDQLFKPLSISVYSQQPIPILLLSSFEYVQNVVGLWGVVENMYHQTVISIIDLERNFNIRILYIWEDESCLANLLVHMNLCLNLTDKPTSLLINGKQARTLRRFQVHSSQRPCWQDLR